LAAARDLGDSSWLAKLGRRTVNVPFCVDIILNYEAQTR
jgi:hypothetical protein